MFLWLCFNYFSSNLAQQDNLHAPIIILKANYESVISLALHTRILASI